MCCKKVCTGVRNEWQLTGYLVKVLMMVLSDVSMYGLSGHPSAPQLLTNYQSNSELYSTASKLTDLENLIYGDSGFFGGSGGPDGFCGGGS